MYFIIGGIIHKYFINRDLCKSFNVKFKNYFKINNKKKFKV